MGTFTVASKEGNDSGDVDWHMKRGRHGIAVSQDNYIRKVDNSDVDAYNYRDGKEVLKENEQSQFWKLVEDINCLAMNTRPDVCSEAMEMVRNCGKARVKGIKRTGRILRNPKEKTSQEACHADRHLKDRRTTFDIAVLRGSVNMSIHSIMWRPGRSLIAEPLTKQGAGYNRLGQVLMFGQVDMGF